MSSTPSSPSQKRVVKSTEPVSSSDRTPQLSNPSRVSNPTFVTKSIRLAVFLYISAHYKLDEDQIAFIAHLQARLNLDQIQKAMRFTHVLTTDPRTRARMKITEKKFFSEETKEWKIIPMFNNKPVPRDNKRPKVRDVRRIGVGYRDKGSLSKKLHWNWEKDNTIQLGESYEEETHHWNANILFEPSGEANQTEPDEVLSDRRVNSRQSRVNLLGTKETSLTGTGNVWCITTRDITFAPGRPSPDSKD